MPALARIRTGATVLRVPATGMIAILVLVGVAAGLVADRFSFGGGTWLWQLDLPKIDYPLATFFHDAIASGRLPLWNDNLGLGFPLYAEGQIGAFYPPNWLFFQLDPLAALDAIRIAHLALAGLGCGVIALRMSGSRSGAILACLVAALGGAITTKLEWTNVVEAYGLLPWVLLPLLRRPRPNRGGLVVAALVWGLQALAGHPNIWLLTGIAAVAMLLAGSPDRQGIGRVLGFGLLGGALGAIQLLPTLALTALSVRSSGVSADDLFTSASTGFDPLGLGFANAFVSSGGDAWDIHSVWFPDGIFALLESTAYVSLAVVGLGAIGARTRRARPLLVVAAVMLVIPVVAAFRPAIWTDIPVLNGLRSPVRSYVVVAAMLGLLAAIGVGRVGRGARGTRLAWAAVGGLIVAYLASLAVASALPAVFDALMSAFSTNLGPQAAAEHRDLATRALSRPLPFVVEAAFGVTAMVAIVFVANVRGARRFVKSCARVGLVGAAAVPLVLFSPQPNSTAHGDAFSSESTAFVQAVRSADAHRLLTIGEPGWYEGMPDQLAMAGVPDLNMFSSLNLQRSDRLLSDVRGQGARAEALRQAVGIDVVVTFGTNACPGTTVATVEQPASTVCRVPALRPPYWLPASTVTGRRGSTGSDAAAHLSAGGALPVLGPIDPSGWMHPTELVVDPAAAVAQARQASVQSWGTTGGTFSVDAPSDGWLWIDRAWWFGWQTTIDGSATTPFTAMGGQLIPVTAGHHVIAQSLVPWDALLGAGLALAGLLLATVWLRWPALAAAGAASGPGVRATGASAAVERG